MIFALNSEEADAAPTFFEKLMYIFNEILKEPIQKTAYCHVCDQRGPFSIGSEKRTITVRGVTFDYQELYAKCKRCGEKVYIPDINDKNVDSREKEYRKAGLKNGKKL